MRRRTFLARSGFGLAATFGRSHLGFAAAERAIRIGYLSLGTPAAEASRVDAFRAELAARGLIEGKNLQIENRWLAGRYGGLAAAAAELAAARVDVIVTYSTPGVRAAQAATRDIPIVFASLGDAVAVGVVPSLSRPGGNVTGTSYFIPSLASKRLELLKELQGELRKSGVLVNPANASAGPVLAALGETAKALGIELIEAKVARADDLADAITRVKDAGATALVIPEDPMLIFAAPRIAELARAQQLTSCGFPEAAEAGCLAAYGIDFVELWRRAAIFVDRIVKGAQPSDLPVEQATKFLTLVNLGTAKALGVTVPPALLSRADQVIE